MDKVKPNAKQTLQKAAKNEQLVQLGSFLKILEGKKQFKRLEPQIEDNSIDKKTSSLKQKENTEQHDRTHSKTPTRRMFRDHLNRLCRPISLEYKRITPVVFVHCRPAIRLRDTGTVQEYVYVIVLKGKPTLQNIEHA